MNDVIKTIYESSLNAARRLNTQYKKELNDAIRGTGLCSGTGLCKGISSTERNNICISLRSAIMNTQSEIDMITADLAAM